MALELVLMKRTHVLVRTTPKFYAMATTRLQVRNSSRWGLVLQEIGESQSSASKRCDHYFLPEGTRKVAETTDSDGNDWQPEYVSIEQCLHCGLLRIV